VGARRGEVPPAREVPEPFLEPERPDRQHVLEPHPEARHQRPALPGTVSSPEIQREPGIRGTRSRDSSTRQPSARHRTDQERANLTDKISRRAALTGKGLSCVSPDIGAAASAQAAEQLPFTINEQITLGPNGPVLETFTATGPLCPSGTFADTVQAIGKSTLIVRSVYTCDDGSGTFNAVKELVSTPGPDDTATSTGPIQLLGGTGAFTDLIGHGVDTGSINFATGTATATDSGVVVRI